MMRRALCFLMCSCAASPLAAQTRALDLAAQARKQMSDNFDSDSAQKLLRSALNLASTPAERIRAWSLLGFAEIGRSNTNGARDAFVQALRIDASLSFDSLMFLEAAQGPNVFALARAIVPLPARPVFPVASREETAVALVLTPLIALDTLVSSSDPRFIIGTQLNRSATVVASILAIDSANRVVWADTLVPGATRGLVWPLRRDNGQYISPGQYMLRLQASDTTGMASRSLDRRLLVTRERADTQPLPAPLEASAFAPETLQVGKRSFRVLLAGGAFAAAVVAAPALLGNSSLNSGLSIDPMSFAVAGGVAVASGVRFVSGRRPTLLSPENALKNRQLRDSWQAERDRIAKANAAAIASAGIRVKQEGQ